MEETFKRFLIGYVSAGHTVDDSVLEELDRLTDEYIKGFYSDYQYFTEDSVRFYLEVLEWNLSDDNKHWFPLRYDRQRYVNCLVNWIKKLSIKQ